MAQKVDPIDPESDEADAARSDFDERVNMTPSEFEQWLETDQSKSVAQEGGGGQSVGHDSGRRIVAILRKRKGDLGAEDYAHMRKVNGYLARHLKQRPEKSKDELREADWTYSLRSWGHDPLK